MIYPIKVEDIDPTKLKTDYKDSTKIVIKIERMWMISDIA